MNATAHVNAFHRWLAVHGNWDHESADPATYLGLQPPDRDPGLLVAPADHALTRGRLATTVHLPTDEGGAQARILLARDPDDRGYISAGLGGHNARYVIEAFEPRHGLLRPLALSEHPPQAWDAAIPIAVHVEGRRLTLHVADILVLSAQMPRALRPSDQLGLFAWAERPVVFEGFEARPQPACVFVAMPFKGYEEPYAEIIGPMGDLARIVRGDNRSGPGSITAQIERDIQEADVVVAEVTATNANVFFEVGYAMAIGKPVILLARRGRKLPFDVNAYRCVYYEPTPEGRARVVPALAEELKAALGNPQAQIDALAGGN